MYCSFFHSYYIFYVYLSNYPIFSIAYAKGFDKKLITVINANLALLYNTEYTDSELVKYLKFLRSNNLEELEALSKGDKILKVVLDMAKKYSSDEKYLATYYLENQPRAMHKNKIFFNNKRDST